VIQFLALVGLLLYVSVPASVKVFLLSGQSNMVGFGKISEIPSGYLSAVKNVGYYAVDYSDVTDKLPYQFSFPIKPGNACTKTECKKEACMERFNFGPEVGIAKVLSSGYPKDKIILIKAAWSGKGLAADWLNSDQPYYPWMIARTNVVLSDVKKWYGAYNFSGMVWLQGETDASVLAWASEYEKNLTEFIRRVRESFKEPSLPFIYGTIQNRVKSDGTKTWAFGNIVVEKQWAMSGIENLGCTSLSSSEKAVTYKNEILVGVERKNGTQDQGCDDYSLGYNIFHYNSASLIFVGESLGRLIVKRAASRSGVIRCE